jgi:outer membrane protease
MLKSGITGGFLLALAGSAFGADLTPPFTYTSENERFSLSTGIGYSWIKADEISYSQGNRVGQLFWAARTPVVTAEMGLKPYGNFTLHARGKVGFKGGGKLDNYFWEPDFAMGFDFDNWTDHTHTDDVRLDRYLSADVAAGYDFHMNDAHTVNLHGGFKYMNSQWLGFGGTSISSISEFRDSELSMSKRLNSVTYEQRLPALFGGANWSAEFGKLSLSALGRLGATAFAQDTTHHWLSAALMKKSFNPAMFMEIGATANYQVAKQAKLFAAAGFEKHWKMKGDTTLKVLNTGDEVLLNDAAGATFQSVTISAGLKVSF